MRILNRMSVESNEVKRVREVAIAARYYGTPVMVRVECGGSIVSTVAQTDYAAHGAQHDQTCIVFCVKCTCAYTLVSCSPPHYRLISTVASFPSTD